MGVLDPSTVNKVLQSKYSFWTLLLAGCSTSQQHASVSQGWICSDSCALSSAEIEVANQFCYLRQSQNTDTGPASPSADSIKPRTWQGSHWSTNYEVTSITPHRKSGDRTQICCSRGRCLVARPWMSLHLGGCISLCFQKLCSENYSQASTEWVYIHWFV